MEFLDYAELTHFRTKLNGVFVPKARTVNGKALSANIALTADDVGAATMTQVNEAIASAITTAMEGTY